MSCACKIGGGPDGVCFGCRSRRAFHERLTKLEEGREAAVAEGRRLERAAIVADLRKQAGDLRRREGGKDLSCERLLEQAQGIVLLDFFANFYETGGHEGSGT